MTQTRKTSADETEEQAPACAPPAVMRFRHSRSQLHSESAHQQQARGRGLPRGLLAPWLARRASGEVTATSLKPASIHQENATILSTYAADNRASTFTKQNCKETDKPQPSGRLHEVLAVAEPTSFSSAHGAFIQTHLTLDIKQASVKSSEGFKLRNTYSLKK